MAIKILFSLDFFTFLRKNVGLYKAFEMIPLAFLGGSKTISNVNFIFPCKQAARKICVSCANLACLVLDCQNLLVSLQIDHF